MLKILAAAFMLAATTAAQSESILVIAVEKVETTVKVKVIKLQVSKHKKKTPDTIIRHRRQHAPPKISPTIWPSPLTTGLPYG